MSAWDYRALYLRDGTKYETFFCPYCDVRLCPYLVYEEGELSKSPHFSAKWEKHLTGCDGKATIVERSAKKPADAHYLPRDMRFPEEFSDRPPPRMEIASTSPIATNRPTLAEIEARRRRAGKLGTPVPKTYLLQPIVEVYNQVFSLGYQAVRSGDLVEEDRLDWTNSILKSMPLKLADKTTYHDAFRTPSYIHPWRPRIYHGRGNVIFSGDRFLVGSDKPAKVAGREALPAFGIKVNRILLTEGSPRSHARLMSLLDEFAATNEMAKWYCYGVPRLEDDSCVIELASLDFLYVKRASRPRSVPTPRPNREGSRPNSSTDEESRSETGGLVRTAPPAR